MNSNFIGTFSEDKDESKVLDRSKNCNFEIHFTDTELEHFAYEPK